MSTMWDKYINFPAKCFDTCHLSSWLHMAKVHNAHASVERPDKVPNQKNKSFMGLSGS